MSDVELEKKSKAIMEEYIHLQDVKEACECVLELRPLTSSLHKFVDTAINHVLERSEQARKQTGFLLHELIVKGIISQDVYMEGMKDVLEFAEDMAVDIPKIYQYLAELISPVVQDGSINLSFLKVMCEPLLSCNKAATLVSQILHNASNRLGHVAVGEMWRKSNLQWSDFLPPNENIAVFISENNLGFTVEDVPHSPDAKTMSIEQLQKELDRLIINENVTNEQLMDWIEINVGEERSKEPQFARALMSAACNGAIDSTSAQKYSLNKLKLKQRVLPLQKYLDHQSELELQALYALQAIVHKLDHPQVLLRDFFDFLYDEDLISEEAFYAWEGSQDPAEQAGKGVAKSSVVQFFAWLGEIDEEEN